MERIVMKPTPSSAACVHERFGAAAAAHERLGVVGAAVTSDVASDLAKSPGFNSLPEEQAEERARVQKGPT